jgi:hypothetical protein
VEIGRPGGLGNELRHGRFMGIEFAPLQGEDDALK